MRTYTLEPKDLGIPRCEIADLAGGDAAYNANLLMVRFGSTHNRNARLLQPEASLHGPSFGQKLALNLC